MPKIRNWNLNKDDYYYKLIHDTTGDSIKLGPAKQTEFREDGNPKKYQITLWSRDGLNNFVLATNYRSKEKAKEECRRIARDNIDGKVIKSMDEKRKCLEWGEGEPKV